MTKEAIIDKMTKEQKQALIEADVRNIQVSTEGNGDEIGGIVNVFRSSGICGTVARTGRDFSNKEDAMEMAEAVIDEVRGVADSSDGNEETAEEIAEREAKEAVAKEAAEKKAAADKKAAAAKKKDDAKKK